MRGSTVLRDRGVEHLHREVIGFAVLDPPSHDFAGEDVDDLCRP